MSNQRLMRTWYPTDAEGDDTEYVGAFSGEFPHETPDRRIVAIDWSVRGVVEVTWLIGGTR